MAKGKKTGGKDFAPGHGVGRPKLPPDLKAAQQLTNARLRELLNGFLYMTPAQLTERLESPEVTMLEGFVGSILQKGVLLGDQARLNFLFDRLVGKVTDKVEVSQPKPFIVQKLDGSEVHCGAKLEEEEK